MAKFTDIFKEYYTLYRGQADTIPAPGEREWNTGIQLGNNAIRKWDRADGQEWNVLKVDFAELHPTPIVAANHTYAITDMRKPPKKVQAINGSTVVAEFAVVDADAVDNYVDLNGIAYFTGSANTGFTLHLPGDLTSVNGATLDFRYLKIPTLIVDGDSVPEMSDVNFMIQDMLASRFSNARNGFGYKTAKQEAVTALMNMKIENNSGTAGRSMNLLREDHSGGFGRPQNDFDIRL